MAIKWKKLPPAEHEPRLNAYAEGEQLFLGNAAQVFKVQTDKATQGVGGRYELMRYISVNFALILSTLSADLVFGNAPVFRIGDQADDDDETDAGDDGSNALKPAATPQEAIRRLVKRNRLHTVNYEAALAASFRGDAVYKVRHGKRTPESKLDEAIIEEAPASIYYPECSPDDVRQVLSVDLAWERTDPNDARKKYIRIERHTPGRIENLLLEPQPGGTAEAKPVPLATLPEYAELPETVETGLEEIPIFHVPNFRYGSRFWGISDYQGIKSLMEAINARTSHIGSVLDSHTDPWIIVPYGTLTDDGRLPMDKVKVMELQPGEQPPSRITWDAHLEAAFTNLEKLIELLMVTAEVSPAIFGLDKYGVAESGRALRLRLIRSIARAERKRQYFQAALEGVLLCAQRLEKIRGGAQYEPTPVTVEWAPSIPEDELERIEAEVSRKGAGLTSTRSALRRIDGPDAVDEEIAEMEEEAGDEATLTGGFGGRGGRPVTGAPPQRGSQGEGEGGAGGDQGGGGPAKKSRRSRKGRRAAPPNNGASEG